jgi:hypothetical protein
MMVLVGEARRERRARERAERRRAPRYLRAVPAHLEEPVRVLVDYSCSPAGVWSAALVTALPGQPWPDPEDLMHEYLGADVVDCRSPREVYDRAMNVVWNLSAELGVPIESEHRLDGDAAAWAEISRREGLDEA